ncbi:phospholipase D family protein [Pseudomonas sp.]|uniref:phospholipase D family protein n=1 Tax=Pseudomonas sp. TaxID=306 RepID=UPI0028A71223|nr:phospholipase D family protein [Pseudomonas sp.]
MYARLLLLSFVLLTGCAQVQTPTPSSMLAPAGTHLNSVLQRQAVKHPGQSGFRLLESSTDAFTARAELIRMAQRSLDIQYYIVHDGVTTRMLVNELLAAADRGVRIRFLLDDTSSDGNDYALAALAAHPNIDVRVFNPLHIGRSTGVTRYMGRFLHLSQQHRRMHNKLLLADNSVAIVGGRNLGDEYFDAKPEMNFTDLDLLGAGPVAHQLGVSFDQYWNSEISQPITGFLRRPPTAHALTRMRTGLKRYLDSERVKDSALYNRLRRYDTAPQMEGWLHELTWANGKALWDAPRKVLAEGEPDRNLLLTTQLMPSLDDVHKELFLVSAYFVPTQTGVEYLGEKAHEGVDIRVLTNSLEATDVPAVHGGYAPYRDELLKQGIKLYEMRNRPEKGLHASPYSFGQSASSLHSKAMVLDHEHTFVGSFNFDPRSILWNTEVGIMVDSPALAGRVRQLILDGMALGVSYQVKRVDRDGTTKLIWLEERDGKLYELHHEPGGLWRRFNAWIVRAVGLERML